MSLPNFLPNLLVSISICLAVYSSSTFIVNKNLKDELGLTDRLGLTDLLDLVVRLTDFLGLVDLGILL